MRQIDLFAAPAGGQLEAELALDDQALQAWRLRVLAYQQPLRQGTPASAAQQANLFETEPHTDHRPPDPLTLPAQHLQFWRWPEALNQGAALYYVFDHGLGPERELLLYLSVSLLTLGRTVIVKVSQKVVSMLGGDFHQLMRD